MSSSVGELLRNWNVELLYQVLVANGGVGLGKEVQMEG
jgi:hypothetical protein